MIEGELDIIGNQRYSEIFKKLVELYIETGQPVSSRILSKTMDNPLSAATIRGVMSDLEELGILYADHISAGRKPTEKGWRIFVDGLIEASNISDLERQTINKLKENASGQSVETILENASDTLSKLSNCVSLVLTPTFDNIIRHIDFVLLSPGRAIVVLVNDLGMVENRLIEVPIDVSPGILEQATKYINTKCAGMTLKDIRSLMQRDVDLQKEGIDRITKKLVADGLGFVAAEERVIIKGQANLVEKSDEISSLNLLLHKFDEQETIKNIIDRAIDGQGVQIFIGAETKMFEMAGCSLIVSSYHDANKKIIGALGILGPARLRYSRIIPLVDYTAKLISGIIGQ